MQPILEGKRNEYVISLPTRHIDCPVCGKSEKLPVYVEHSTLVRCRTCGLLFYDPQPTPEAIREYYSSPIGYIDSIDKELEKKRADPHAFDALHAQAMERIERFHPEKGTLLDVGCAHGFFLDYARKRGWKVRGVELARKTADYAKKEFGLDVVNSSLIDAGFPEGSFDAVVMLEVLEHVMDPVAELREIARVLRKGGVVYITTPNFDSLTSREFKQAWECKSYPNHLFYFTRNSINALLRKAGLEPVHLASEEGRYPTPGADAEILKRKLGVSDAESKGMLKCLYESGLGPEWEIVARKN